MRFLTDAVMQRPAPRGDRIPVQGARHDLKEMEPAWNSFPTLTGLRRFFQTPSRPRSFLGAVAAFRVPDDVAARHRQRTHQGDQSAPRSRRRCGWTRQGTWSAHAPRTLVERRHHIVARRRHMRDAPACNTVFKSVLRLPSGLWCGYSLYCRHFAPGDCAVPVRPGSMACTPRTGGIAGTAGRPCECVSASSRSRRAIRQNPVIHADLGATNPD